jgi:hypothetical protein
MPLHHLPAWIRGVFQNRGPVERQRNRRIRPALQELETRAVPATLPVTFEVPALVAAKGVYVGIFGQLENGTTGYTLTVPYVPTVGPSTGQSLQGNDWVYLSSAATGSTTLGPATTLTTSIVPTSTALVVASVAGFPTTGGTITLNEPGQTATGTYTSISGNSLLGFTFTANPAGFGTTTVIALQSISVAGPTLAVGSTANFPSAGRLIVESATGNVVLSYTGTTATTFTGVTGGTGSLPGGSVIVPAPVVAATTLASAASIGDGALTVAAGGTAGFPSSGSLTLITAGTTITVAYTGLTANTFTGVTGITSAFPIGSTVSIAMDYALAPKGQNLPLVNLFPNPAALPKTNATVTATVYLPDFLLAPMTSGQIVISVGQPMAIPVDATKGSIASPGVGTNPNDIFGLFEWGWDSQKGAVAGGVLDIDISEVDQVGFPFKASTSPAMPAPAQDGTGMIQDRDTLFNGFVTYINSLDPASNASVFLEGSPFNSQTTFPIGTRITAPQDILASLEDNGPNLAGTVTQGGSLTVDPTGNDGYYYVVTAVSATGESMASEIVRLKPYSISGQPTNYATASLTWAAYPFATGYKVYRGTTSGFNTGTFVDSSLSLMTLTTLSASTLSYTDGSALPPTPQPANNQPPINNYKYDLLNQYYTAEVNSFFDNYKTNEFVLDSQSTNTTWKGKTTTITEGPNTYTVLALTGYSGQYGGAYAGYTAYIYSPIFSSNTDQTSAPAAPSWLVNPSASPASMIFGCDGVFDTPDNAALPSTTLSASSFTMGGATLNVGSTAGFASAGTLVIGGPGNTNQTVRYTGITGTSFTGVTYLTGGTGTFTAANVFGTSSTANLAGGSLVLPNATVIVSSTTGFPGSGTLQIAGTPASPQTVAYTGTSATTFTGVTGGAGTFTSGTATASFAQNTFSTAPSGIIKDVMNSFASAFNRGIATDFTLPPTYWAADPNPLTGQAATATASTALTSAVTLPTNTIAVTSTASFPSAGSLKISNGPTEQTVTYTGKTATTFTGVSGLSNAFASGSTVALVGTLSPGTYYYAITAVNVNGDTTGNESTPSNMIAVTVAGANAVANLNWLAINAPGGAIGAMTAASFNIYRGTSPTDLRLIGSVANPGPSPTSTFQDAGAAAGTKVPSVTYYAKGSTANWYSAYFHNPSVSINGLAYGFPYDDQGGFSTNVQMNTPDNVTITMLPWSGSTQLVAAIPATAFGGKATTLTVTAQDASGQVLTDFVGTVTFTSTDPLATLPASYTFVAGDHGVHTFNVTLRTEGLQTVTINDAANSLQVVATTKVVTQQQSAFIERLYLDLLDRHGEPAGLAYWNGLLNNGTPRAVIVAGFESSVEYRTIQIEGFYVTLLNRPSDPAGMTFFLNQTVSNLTLQEVKAIFFSSPEYYQSRGGSTNLGYLTALYHDQLGRTLDSVGQQFWLAALAGPTTRDTVAFSILRSVESDANYIHGIYSEYLLRTADAPGLVFWSNNLVLHRQRSILADFLATDEFYTL